MSREGQQRVEVRPGAFVWMNEADNAAFVRSHAHVLELSKPETAAPAEPESAAIAAPERATMPRPKVRKGR